MKKKIYLASFLAAMTQGHVHSMDSYGAPDNDVQESQESKDAKDGNVFNNTFHFFVAFGPCISIHRFANEYTYGSKFADGSNIFSAYVRGSTEKEIGGSVTSLAGSLLSGIAIKMPSSPFYVSIEGGFDFGPQAKLSSYANDTRGGRVTDIEVIHGGLTPSLAAKIGAVFRNSILLYLKVGGKYIKVKEHYVEYNPGSDTTPAIKGRLDATSENKISAITPIIALGVEKHFTQNASVRLEGEYTLGKDKTKNFGDMGSTKLKIKDSCTIRALFAFNIGVGKGS
ncbi:MAG: hypothetical protein LBT63_00295 [Holosporaceae bacterium]|jgi:hypothetical protein|nr:hypothetical protein [Holosporaceae bacterium]